MQPSMPENLLEHLDEAVSEVFDLMLSRACTPSALPMEPTAGLTALVHFSGALNGACTIHLDLSSAGELTEHLTGEPPEPDSPLAADTVGELCNMIAGLWKSRLAPPLAACQLSSPTIGTGYTAQAETQATTVTRSYQFAPHWLTLQLTLA